MSDPVIVRQIDFLRAFPWLRLGRALGCALSWPGLIIAVGGVLAADWSRWALLQALPAVNWLEPAWVTDVPPVQHVFVPFWNFHGAEWPLIVIGVVAALVWSFFGVALCRCAATEFCRDEGAEFRGSVQLAIRQLGAPLGALATPMVGIMMLGALIALLAIPAFIPALGGVWLRVVSPAISLLGIAASVILLVLPILWPLMIAAVAVDDSDGFDAFSRSFSFVTSHPWMTAGLVAAAYGVIWAASAVIGQGVVMAAWFVAWSADWTASDIALTDSLMPATQWWLQLSARALQTSLFWSLATVVYLLLRQVTDGKPLDQLTGYDEPPRPREDFPVVGIPAMNPPASADASAPAAE
ncbi:MAG TPA: hypothetical protein VFG20_13925 [Planctomycetaceae bacterium]|nr:hypothetical protein [Planctomycetaceae bacterium]